MLPVLITLLLGIPAQQERVGGIVRMEKSEKPNALETQAYYFISDTLDVVAKRGKRWWVSDVDVEMLFGTYSAAECAKDEKGRITEDPAICYERVPIKTVIVFSMTGEKLAIRKLVFEDPFRDEHAEIMLAADEHLEGEVRCATHAAINPDSDADTDTLTSRVTKCGVMRQYQKTVSKDSPLRHWPMGVAAALGVAAVSVFIAGVGLIGTAAVNALVSHLLYMSRDSAAREGGLSKRSPYRNQLELYRNFDLIASSGGASMALVIGLSGLGLTGTAIGFAVWWFFKVR